jgi:hypothetical protein
MTVFLYPNFLTDQNEYEQAESRWRHLWDELVRRVGQQHLWKSPWLNTRCADGTPFRDGNPIFSAVCPLNHLGVRVLQQEPEGNPKDLSFWTDVFAKGEPEEVRELVISCALTPETLNYAADLMRQWLTRQEVSLSYEGYFPTFPLDPCPVTERQRELVA